jgi:hypothetical protein
MRMMRGWRVCWGLFFADLRIIDAPVVDEQKVQEEQEMEIQ